MTVSVLLINDGVRYYYDINLTGLDEFYEYAITLNLMSGDSIKSREIQAILDELKSELDELKSYNKNLRTWSKLYSFWYTKFRETIYYITVPSSVSG